MWIPDYRQLNFYKHTTLVSTFLVHLYCRISSHGNRTTREYTCTGRQYAPPESIK